MNLLQYKTRIYALCWLITKIPFGIFTFWSLVGVVILLTGYSTHTRGTAVWFLAGARDFLFSKASTPVLRLTHFPSWWFQELSPRGKRGWDVELCLKFPICPCNENQPDALFILSLFRQSICTCFGHIYSPSSGGILYIHNNWYVLCFLIDCPLAGLGWNVWNSIPPDDRLQTCPKYVQVDLRNKLRINSASSWFSL